MHVNPVIRLRWEQVARAFESMPNMRLIIVDKEQHTLVSAWTSMQRGTRGAGATQHVGHISSAVIVKAAIMSVTSDPAC